MPFAVGRKRTLHRDRALCGAPRAREGDHETIAECLNFMSPMGRDLLSKDFGVDANDFMGAQVTQLFAKRRRQNRRQVWLLGVGTRSGVECHTLFTVAFEQPGGGGLLWSTSSLILRCRCWSV
jgi:hypothetical protein